MKLRSHLVVLTIGTLLPMVAFAIAGASWLTERERSTFEVGATARVRAVLTALDTELRSSVTTLQALASLSDVADDDLRKAHAEMTRVLASYPDWLSLSLANPAGGQLINASYPYGAKLPAIRERVSLEHVVQTAEPAIGNLVPGLPWDRQQFSIRVPIVVDGSVKYVLSAAVRPETISVLLVAQ